MQVVQWLMSNGLGLLAALNALLLAAIAFFALIPGDQPEKALQSVVDFIAKFSKK